MDGEQQLDAWERMRTRHTSFTRSSPGDIAAAISMIDAHEHAQPSSVRTTVLSDEDVMDALTLIPLARQILDRAERDLITAARVRNTSWRSIAARLGLDSPQGAQARHRRLCAARAVVRRTV